MAKSVNSYKKTYATTDFNQSYCLKNNPKCYKLIAITEIPNCFYRLLSILFSLNCLYKTHIKSKVQIIRYLYLFSKIIIYAYIV